MRVLVTGALGFSGLHLLRRLEAEPATRIIGLDRSPSVPRTVPLDDYCCGDLADAGIALNAVRTAEPDVVIHLAGLMNGPRLALWRANVRATLKLLAAVARARPSAKVLLIGSAAEYGEIASNQLPVREIEMGHPESEYAITKCRMTRLAQAMARRFGVRTVVARPFNLVGLGMPSTLVAGAVLDRAKTAIRDGRDDVMVGTLTHVRDFVNVTDAVEAYWRLAQVDRWGEVFNVCTGVGRSVQSLLEELLTYAPRPLRLVQSDTLAKSGEVSVMYGSPEKTEAATGFRPSPDLSAALRDAWGPMAPKSLGEEH